MIVLDNGDALRGVASVASKIDYTVNGYVGTTATQLADGQVGASEADLYLSGADSIVITSITLVNTDTATRTVDLFVKPSAGTSRRIVPKTLSLGISHSLYTDGQRIAVMDASGQILSTWAVDDTPVNGETDKPISSNWAYDHAITPPLSHLMYQLTTRAHVLYIPCLAATDLTAGGGWTAVTGGAGATCDNLRNLLRVKCNSAIGDATYYREQEPLYPISFWGVNWDKELYIQVFVVRIVEGAGAEEVQGYVQLKTVNTKGALTSKGLGIRIKGTNGYSIRGESYNTAEGTAAFNADLTTGLGVFIGIHHRPGVSDDFYVNGVLQTNNITEAAQVPSGATAAAMYLVISLETTDDPNAAIDMRVGSFFIIQAH